MAKINSNSAPSRQDLLGSAEGSAGWARWVYPAMLCFVWLIAYIYTFDSDLDLNGDNCVYYILAQSLAQGTGYMDMSSGQLTNVFPPGYPLLMTPLMWLTDSVVAQKVMNGLFMLAAVLLLYNIVVRCGQRRELVFLASVGVILSERILNFATMMMSEMSFLLCSAVVVIALLRQSQKIVWWRDKWFWVMMAALALAYHCRTQGIALIAAAVVGVLFCNKWGVRERIIRAAGTIAGFVLLCLPWMLRNRLQGLPQSRYFETISQANAFRPEDGTLDIGGIVSRFFDTCGMLISQALPNSIIPNVPYSNIWSFDKPISPDTQWVGLLSDYSQQPQTVGLWLIGLLSLSLIIYGFWLLRPLRWLLISYLVFTFGIIAIFSTPSGNRYITCLIPFLTIGQFVGLYALLSRVWKAWRGAQLSPWVLVVLLLFCKGSMSYLHATKKAPLPPSYANYIDLALSVRAAYPPETVVSCRKQQLFALYSGTRATGYAYSSNDTIVVREMVKAGVDLVILDQLGFASTGLYLFPAIQKHPDLFTLIDQRPQPDTYLIKFNKQAAEQWLTN